MSVSRVRDRLDRARLRWRRHRLTMAYAKVAKRRYERPPGFSSLMIAIGMMVDDGVLERNEAAEEDEDADPYVWNWPEGSA